MKKSVLFYSDWYEILKELPDDERVRAYDAIMQFAFEDVEPTDKYIKAITALIIKGIINNRNQYEEICERNRQKALKRWGRTNTNNAVAYKSIQKHTSGYSGIQVNTNDTSGCYNDNDNDNDNELANANNINKEIKENIKKENKESQASFIDEYFAKTTFIESFCMQNHTTPEEMRTMAEAIIIEWDAAGVRHANYTEAHNHLTSTLRIRVRESKRNGNNMQVDNRPPRPSVHHIWSESQQKWVYSI